MAHFAKIVDTKVVEVIVVSNDNAATEAAGQAFISSIGLDGEWLQTSYSGSFRAIYAGPGYTYDSVADVFVGIPFVPPTY